MASVSLFQPTVVRGGKREKTKVWWMAWRDDRGKLHRKSTGARQKAVAKQIANEQERQLTLDPWGLVRKEPKRVTWSEMQVEYLAHLKATCRPDTAIASKSSLDQFAKHYGDTYTHEITVPILESFIAIRRQTVAVATINKDLRHIRAALNWAVDHDYLPATPKFRGLFLRQNLNAPVVVARSNRQLMLEALDDPNIDVRVRTADWWRAFVMIIAELGVRRGEALGLAWGSVDMIKQEVTIAAESSKGRRYRTLPMTPELVETLTKWKKQTDKSADADRVLPWGKQNIRAIYVDWGRICKTAGLPQGTKIVPKNFRSTAGSEMIQAGVPTVVVKDLLGHASVTTTERHYVNTSSSLKAAAEARRAAMAQADQTK